MAHLPGFGHDREALATALAEAEGLRTRLAQIEGSSAYQLGLQLDAEIDGFVADQDELLQAVSGDIEVAVAKARTAEIRKRAAPLIRMRVAAALAAETDDIDQAAAAEADEAAERAVERFRAHDAGPYREQVRARLARTAAAVAVRGVQQQIADEEVAAAGGGAVEEASVEPESRGELKARAAEIRGLTKRSKILQYSMLRLGDVITLCFASSGQGDAPYTSGSGYGWSGTYDSSREVRKLSLKLLDPTHGSFEVIGDDIQSGTSLQQFAIRPGREILALSDDPDTDEEDLSPMLVKACPVVLEALTGKTVGNPNLDLWWVGLGKDEFKILS